MARRYRRLLYALGALAGLILLLVTSALIILPSSWFREKVRARIVYEIERATGGRTEIGEFRFEWTKLRAEIAPFVLHGTEPPNADPLFRAASIQVDLTLVSMMRRDIDVASVVVEQPQVNLLVDEQGNMNLPKPKVQRPPGKHPVEHLVNLSIREITLRNGSVHYGDREIPLDVRGRYMDASLEYNFADPSYQGRLKIGEVTVDTKPTLPMTVSLDSRIGLYRNYVQIHRAVLSMKDTTVEVAGTIEDFRKPQVRLDLRAAASVAEIGPPLRLPRPHVGQVNFTGQMVLGSGTPLHLMGRATGQHLAIQQGRVRVEQISFASDVDLTRDKVALRDVVVHALHGVFRGMIDIRDFEDYKINGRMTGVSIRSLTRMAGLRESNLAGTMNGPVEVSGSFDNAARTLRAGGRFDVAATQEGVPVQGFVEVAYNGRTEALQLGRSYLTLPSSRLEFNGTLGEQLQVRVESRDLKDFLPALALASDDAPKQLPVQLRSGGSAQFEGTVSGPMTQPQVAGRLTASGVHVQNQNIDRVVADLSANSGGLRVSSFALGQDTLRLAGNLELGLQQWRVEDSSAVSGSVKLENARLQKLLTDAGQKLPVEGLLFADAVVSGTAGSPRATLRMRVEQPEIYGEKFDRIAAEVRYAGNGVEVINGVAAANGARVLLSGIYSHPEDDWKNGRIQFKLNTQGWALERIQNLQKRQPEIAGALALKAQGTINVQNGELRPAVLDGDLDLQNVTVDGRIVGSFDVDARTVENRLNLTVAGNVRGARVNGKAAFRLAGDYPGSGEVAFSPIPFQVIQDLVAAREDREPLPLDGYLAGRITFNGPARHPERMQARAEFPTFQIVPARRALTARQVAELALRNEEPVVVEYDGKALQVRSAHFVGRDTDLRIAGTVGVAERVAWDLRVNGNLNVGVLQDFNQDLVSSGVAVINASVRGPIKDPNLTGRMELKNASFYLADFPNGLDNANGTIIFDQRRATIEKLTAVTGGGNIALSGFVGFTGEIIYRLQARADSVRIRYPEGVSTTSNATVSLTGTPSKSLLAGVVTIARAGFNPRTDIGGLIASAPTPVATPASENEFLRNMQLDVRVETTPNLQLQTALTTNLQAEADLRVRGTAARPVVLGRVVVSQGEIQFFGNKYTINRGEIGFFNPVRIEPVLDMDLETRVRGVLVNMNFNGSLQRLNVSYRSDPPLQSTEIIALLAVGRAPGTNSTLASTQMVTSPGIFAGGTNSLLGQAVAAPISGRLQRFFGVSRLKIDPQLTGLSAVPQARLTIEQQISRAVTLTYVTNLAQANQQIIRLEWDLNRTWSVVAVREENGVFGVDFLFKKRFR